MTDHRRLQRALFRMQMDPRFAQSVFAGDADALASTGLADDDVALLCAADPIAVRADRHAKRQDQLLGNVTSEFRLSAALALARHGAELLADFLSSPEFHDGISADRRLPLAYAAYAERRARGAEDEELLELVRLEAAMAHLRRAHEVVERPVSSSAPVLSPRARLVELAGGTLARATSVRKALDAGRPVPRRAGDTPDPSRAAAAETVLLVATPPPNPHRLGDVVPEALEPLVAALLRHAEEPLDAARRDAFAAEHGIGRTDLDAFVDELVREGVLAGPG